MDRKDQDARIAAHFKAVLTGEEVAIVGVKSADGISLRDGKLVAVEHTSGDGDEVVYTPINAKKAEVLIRKHDTIQTKKDYKAKKDVRDIEALIARLT